MAFSVNTNAGAFVALQNLNATNTALATTQNRVSTGLEVSGAQDSAARFTIAQGLRGDVAGLNAVSGSLSNASSALSVGLSATEAISDILIDLEELAVTASDDGLDAASRDALDAQFGELVGQISSIVSSAEFNGTNIISATPDNITALTSPTPGAATISINGVDLEAQATALAAVGLTGANGDNADAAITAITAATTAVNGALGSFGAGANRLEIQAEFTQSLSDTIEVGIGNLVDADLAQESANLQALQVQQQLGLSALSIANQAPGAVLSLF
ncbi:flagellin [Kordiimonas sp. SCSIO 12610]|uniref:flagellin n=1 Tax=Kordiimonas sp. SCSIO 12610 TaxID=2829597 RepID=UPI00210BA3DC|nr:flagellin [Kordiimonas sp. SCSIO 12610]UTW54193.1 flagellin [Kordiimonas sp. SCSIO 12610]